MSFNLLTIKVCGPEMTELQLCQFVKIVMSSFSSGKIFKSLISNVQMQSFSLFVKNALNLQIFKNNILFFLFEISMI